MKELSQEFHVLINFYIQPMKYINLLMWGMKFEVCFLIKYLKKYGMRASFLN